MNTLEEFVKDNKALFQQEQLLLEVTELLVSVMKDNGISKSELAQKIGKSKAFVTQCLSGDQNLTLRTISDLFLALGYKLQLGAVPTAAHVYKKMIRLYPIGGWSMERCEIDSLEICQTSVKANHDPALSELFEAAA